VGNQNEKNQSSESYRVGDCSLRVSISADISVGQNGSEKNKTRINTWGGKK
jgi:hypothetical protein